MFPGMKALRTRKSPARRGFGGVPRKPRAGLLQVNPGGDLLSQGAPPQVPSAQAGLTAVFDMGTGVSPPPWPPEIYETQSTTLLERCIASTNNEKNQALGRLVPVG